MSEEASDLEKLRKEQKPVAAPELAATLASTLFGLELDQAPQGLDSYDDVNYLLHTTDGARFVLKIHNGADSAEARRGFLEAQNAVLLHLSGGGASASAQGTRAPVPVGPLQLVTLPLRSGEPCVHAVRLLTFVDGPLMSDCPHPPALLRTLGAFAGRLSTALQAFDHPAAHRRHLWDLAQLPALQPFVAFVDPARQSLVQSVLARYHAQIVPVAGTLPQSVCHNDLNDHNIVLSPSFDQVAGVIDFGDMVFTWRVAELAICVAYACLDKDDLVGTARAVIAGFCATCADITPAELGLVHALASARLCQSVIMSSYSFSRDPTNTYLLVTSAPGWAALAKLNAMNEAEIRMFNGAEQ